MRSFDARRLEMKPGTGERGRDPRITSDEHFNQGKPPRPENRWSCPALMGLLRRPADENSDQSCSSLRSKKHAVLLCGNGLAAARCREGLHLRSSPLYGASLGKKQTVIFSLDWSYGSSGDPESGMGSSFLSPTASFGRDRLFLPSRLESIRCGRSGLDVGVRYSGFGIRI